MHVTLVEIAITAFIEAGEKLIFLRKLVLMFHKIISSKTRLEQSTFMDRNYL